MKKMMFAVVAVAVLVGFTVSEVQATKSADYMPPYNTSAIAL